MNKNTIFDGCHHAGSSRDLNFYLRVKKVSLFPLFFLCAFPMSHSLSIFRAGALIDLNVEHLQAECPSFFLCKLTPGLKYDSLCPLNSLF